MTRCRHRWEPTAEVAHRRCVCHGTIVAEVSDPGPAVFRHGRSTEHVAWRLGMRPEDLRPGLPTPDGQPVIRLVRVA